MSSLEFGVPKFSLHPRVEKEVVEMKRRLLEGKDSILKTTEREIRQVFPLEVKNLAVKHWEEITVTEPAKHRRLSKVVKDKDETTPTRYQTMTNDESYDSFKEACSEEVTAVMKVKAREMVAVVSRRPDSADRQNRLRYAEQVLPNKFPCKTWWLQK